MSLDDFGIIGLECEYPQFKYTTQELIEILGNKLSEKTVENIKQLGVEERYFVRPIEHFVASPKDRFSLTKQDEPIAEISSSVAKKCLSNLGLKLEDVTCFIAASEDHDYLSPGLSSVLVRKIGLSNFIPHFNIQGMACSTFPKVLELGKNLVRNKNDKVLVVISGCNSGWYLPHLTNDMTVRSPKEVNLKQYDKDSQIKKWVSTMFSFLFGDGAVAFVLSKTDGFLNVIKIGKFSHAINLGLYDYKKACVWLNEPYTNHLYEYELTAGHDILPLSLEYSKKVLMKLLGKDPNNYDQELAQNFMSENKKVMIHTGSLKILDGFKNLYNLKSNQIQDSYDTLQNYGNLTGCSLPTVISKAFSSKELKGKGLLIGITMGFGLDMVQVEKV